MADFETLKGVNRPLRIPPCELTVEDLRKLAARMEEYAKEAADRELQSFKQLEGQTPEQFEQFKSELRDLLRLWVSVQSGSGEWRGGAAGEVLRDDALPDVVAGVSFDTSFAFRVRANRDPNNGVVLNLDCRRRNFFDFSNSADAAQERVSSGHVAGADVVWADGVHERLRQFFSERRTIWGLLHGTHAYDVLLMLVGLPLAFFWVDRADGWLSTLGATPAPAVRVGVLIYVLFLLLYGFRLIFNLACRVFPRTKGPRSGTGGGFREGAWLVLTLAAWFSTLFLDSLLRWAGGIISRQ